MFMHWPGVIAAGGDPASGTHKAFNHPVNALDFYPTFARLSGGTVPEKVP
jgi:hypothetical protein